MNRMIPIPLAAQVVALRADWSAWVNARSSMARIMAERRTRVLEPHIALWLAELAVASEPLGMRHMNARYGKDGVTKSHLTRSITVLIERGHAKLAHRGAKNAGLYVITASGRAVAAEGTRGTEVRQ